MVKVLVKVVEVVSEMAALGTCPCDTTALHIPSEIRGMIRALFTYRDYGLE